MLEPNELKDILSEKLTNHLGEFIRSDNSRIPAIWIKGPFIPPHYQCKGLEVVIYATPDVSRFNVTGGKVDHRWLRVKLTQYDQAKDTSEAFEIIRNSFPVVKSQLFERTRDLPETRIVLIYDPVFVEMI